MEKKWWKNLNPDLDKKKTKEPSGRNCNPEVNEEKGELQILGFRDESQHIVM